MVPYCRDCFSVRFVPGGVEGILGQCEAGSTTVDRLKEDLLGTTLLLENFSWFVDLLGTIRDG
jgi:hypothetical protein